jgi:hypothetical protein
MLSALLFESGVDNNDLGTPRGETTFLGVNAEEFWINDNTASNTKLDPLVMILDVG